MEERRMTMDPEARKLESEERGLAVEPEERRQVRLQELEAEERRQVQQQEAEERQRPHEFEMRRLKLQAQPVPPTAGDQRFRIDTAIDSSQSLMSTTSSLFSCYLKR